MADISKIKLPDGATYNVKDTVSGYITANTAPVTSVNGDIGDVTITEGLEPLIGTTATVTPQQVMTALGEGRDICIEAETTFVLLSLKLKFTDFNRATDNFYSGAVVDIVVSQTIVSDNENWYVFTLTGGTRQGQTVPWTVNSTAIVPASRTINGNTLDSNITLTYSDVNAVPVTRTVNNKALSSDITLTASDVGAVPTTRKVNNKALSADITLDANDVGALPDSTIIPSKTSDLTNDSGFITNYTDEKLKTNAITVGNTYYPIVGNNSTTASSKYIDATGLSYSVSSAGFSTLTIGNNLTTSDKKLGVLKLYGMSTGSLSLYTTHDIGDYTINFPAANGTIALTTNIPTKTSDLTNDSGFITGYTETDPTVPSWAKASTKPSYTASEVGALPDTTVIPPKSTLYYGQVDSTSTSTAFTAQIPGITEYFDGLTIILKNGVVTSASGFTININGLGAKHAYSNMAAATAETSLFNINYTMMFIYDSTRVSGGGWILYRGYYSDSNSIGYQLKTASMSLPMTSTVYRYRLLFTSADREHFVPATNSTSTNATSSRTVCQNPIDPFGEIRYYGTTAAVAAGSRPAVANLWEQYGITLGYSFNRTGAALVLTHWKPVYVKCAPQSDGSAIIDADTPYVQTLPSTEDGKIYIYLGVAYTDTQVEIVPHHPVYWYKDGMIRPYTNASASSGGVTSVNGQTGDVTISVPTKTSDLTNDGEGGSSGFVTGTDVNGIVSLSLLSPTFCATDATSQAVLQQAFGASAEIVVPSDITSIAYLLSKLEPRTWFAWMNGTEMEFAKLSVSVNTGTSAITLYLRGRTSIATGIMGVDSSWTVTDILPIYNGGVS